MIKKDKKNNEPLDLRHAKGHTESVKDTHRILDKMEIALGSRLKNRKEANEDRVQKDEDISDGLKEIYQENKAGDINVGNISKNKKSGVFFWMYNILFFVGLLVCIYFGFLYYINLDKHDSNNIVFTVENKDIVEINEEFFYTVKYQNLSDIILNDVKIKVEYPNNFIFIDSVPEKNSDIGDVKVWDVGQVMANSNGEIKIKGKIINKNNSNILLAEMAYSPSNFPSVLKKETSAHISLREHDWSWDMDIPTTILVGENEDMFFEFSLKKENYLSNFIIDIVKPNGMEIINITTVNEQGVISKISGDDSVENWQVGELVDKNKFKIQFKFNERPGDNNFIEFNFKKNEPDKEYVFFSQNQELEVIKSDLDLVLIINGSSEDKTVDFGEKLNYSISYTNKGDTPLEDVSMMVVLDSNFLDWTTFKDENSGIEKGNTVIWGKNEISKLSTLEVGENGNIDFSINVMPFVVGDQNLKESVLVKSYARFNIRNELDSFTTSTLALDNSVENDDQSNIIVNKINSDLTLNEEIRYFNSDNIPVGVGPLPPSVGDETSFKVYWTIKNNLHELEDIKVKTNLPTYMKWNDKQRTSVGDIVYNKDEHSVVWDVGKLPLAIYRADAEFSVSVTPTDDDKNKIMIFLTGSEIEAIDTETESEIKNSTSPKTSKLEGDEIAQYSSDGRVVD